MKGVEDTYLIIYLVYNIIIRNTEKTSVRLLEYTPSRLNKDQEVRF